MTAYTQMKNMLTPTSVYTLDGTTLIDFELTAYAKAIKLIADILDEIDGEAFLDDGTTVAKARYLSMFGDNYPSTGDADNDLEALMAGTLGTGRLSEIEDMLDELSLDCTLSEDYDDYKITLLFNIEELTYLDEDKLEMISQVLNKIEEYIPSHLKVTSDIAGTTWTAIEGYNKTFNQWDTLGLSWNIFDN